MTKRTRRRRLRVLAGGASACSLPPAEPVGELLRSDLVTFGAASLWVLTTPGLSERLLNALEPSWDAVSLEPVQLLGRWLPGAAVSPGPAPCTAL